MGLYLGEYRIILWQLKTTFPSYTWTMISAVNGSAMREMIYERPGHKKASLKHAGSGVLTFMPGLSGVFPWFVATYPILRNQQ